MDSDTAYKAFFWLLCLLAFIVGVVSLVRKKRQKQDFIMGIGALMASFSGGFFYLIMLGEIDGVSDPVILASIGISGLGMMGFAMGFVCDQIRTRRILKMREELEGSE